MKLTVQKAMFANALKAVKPYVSSKPNLPVLAHFLLVVHEDEAVGSNLQISGTNLEAFMTTRVSCNVVSGGEWATSVPAALLTELVESLEEGELELVFEEERQKLTVKQWRTQATLNCISAEDYPNLNVELGDEIAELQPETLAGYLANVAIFASGDETRPVLTCEYFEVTTEGFKLAAADSFRLISVNQKLEGLEATSPKTLLIPAKFLAGLSRLLSKMGKDEKIRISVSKNNSRVFFISENWETGCSLVEGKFPNYDVIIPRNSTTTAQVKIHALTQAVKRASVFAKEGIGSSNTVRLNFGVEGITVATDDTGYGNNSSMVDATVEGPEVAWACNAKYLRDALDCFEQAGDVVVSLTGGGNPARINKPGLEGVDIVVMPMHIGPR